MSDKQPPREPAYRKRIGYQAGLLGGFATMAAVLLLMGDMLTRDAILARQLEDLRASLGQVIPASLHDNQPDQDVLPLTDARGRERRVYRAIGEGQVQAVAFQSTGSGYAGAIEILLGIRRDGSLLGVRVLSHAETPGLGDKIEVERDDWILDFNGKSLESPAESQWKVKKDGGQFEQFTGATITPRAVVTAVADGLRLYRANSDRLLHLEPVGNEPASPPDAGGQAQSRNEESPEPAVSEQAASEEADPGRTGPDRITLENAHAQQ